MPDDRPGGGDRKNQAPASLRCRGPQGLGEEVACALGERAKAGESIGAVEEESFFKQRSADNQGFFDEQGWALFTLVADHTAEHQVRLRWDDRWAVHKPLATHFGSGFPIFSGLMRQTDRIGRRGLPPDCQRESAGGGFPGCSPKTPQLLTPAAGEIAGKGRTLADNAANNAGTGFVPVFPSSQQTGHASPRCATWSVFFCRLIALNRKGDPDAV